MYICNTKQICIYINKQVYKTNPTNHKLQNTNTCCQHIAKHANTSPNMPKHANPFCSRAPTSKSKSEIEKCTFRFHFSISYVFRLNYDFMCCNI